MKECIVAVGCTEPGQTPLMPFIGERFTGGEFTAFTRLKLEIALLRCDLDVIDCGGPRDMQDIVMQANHGGAACIAVVSYGAFGSRRSFNDVGGASVLYSTGRQIKRSRELCEDICAKLVPVKKCVVRQEDLGASGAACPVAVIEGGYLTQFDEAKLMCDPDFAEVIAEHAAMGICEYLDMPYIPGSELDLAGVVMGRRGKKVKLLQAALCAAGYDVTVDGLYGRNTELAYKRMTVNNESKGDIPLGSKCDEVRYIQKKLRSKLYRSPQTGVMDEATVDAVNEFLADSKIDLRVSDSVPEKVIEYLSHIGGGKPRLI